MRDEVVEGMQELLDSMEGLPLALQKRLIVRSLRKGAEPIRQEAANLAPDDPTTAGSRVKESMSITVTDQTATGATANIGPSRKGFMGIFAEQGTKRQPAKPFLQRAFDSKYDAAYNALEEELGDSIEKEFLKRDSTL